MRPLSFLIFLRYKIVERHGCRPPKTGRENCGSPINSAGGKDAAK